MINKVEHQQCATQDMLHILIGKHCIFYSQSDWNLKRYRLLNAAKNRPLGFGILCSHINASTDIRWSWGLKKCTNSGVLTIYIIPSSLFLTSTPLTSQRIVSQWRWGQLKHSEINWKTSTYWRTYKHWSPIFIFSTSSESQTGGRQCRTRLGGRHC